MIHTFGNDSQSINIKPRIRFIQNRQFRVVLVQPSSGSALRASETRTVEKGLFDETVRVIYGRGPWPGGPHSKIRVLNGPEGADDLTYQQAGSAVHYGASPMTAHYKVRVDAIGVESK